jgi:hypothetical protein
VVLDLHCDGEALLHLYTTPQTWPGDGQLLARCIGAELALLAERSGGDPFDEACSMVWPQLAERLGPAKPLPPACMAATIELRGEADVRHDLAAGDAQGIVNFLIQRGVVAPEGGVPPALPALKREATPLAGSIPVVAPPAAWWCSCNCLAPRWWPASPGGPDRPAHRAGDHAGRAGRRPVLRPRPAPLRGGGHVPGQGGRARGHPGRFAAVGLRARDDRHPHSLKVENLHKRFGEREVLRGVSLQAQPGDVVAIIGSSGSGKSTLLRCLNLLEQPHEAR